MESKGNGDLDLAEKTNLEDESLSDPDTETPEVITNGLKNRGKRRPSAVLDNLNMGCSGKRSGIALVAVGLTLAVFSVSILLNFEPVFRWILGRRVVLSPKSQGFPIWKDVSNHLDTRVAWYFFNLTNPDEFKEGEIPILAEVGPFWYKANLTKKHIHFINSNSSVNFEEHRSFEFDATKSVLSQDAEITMVNVPLMAAAIKVNKMGYFTRYPVLGALSTMKEAQNGIVKYKVRELAYEGQQSTLMGLASFKEGLLEGLQILNDPDNVKNRFGFGVDKNETNPGVFNMYTGATGVNDLNRVHSMDGKHVLDIWPDDHNNTCNILEGTFGNLRPPMRETNEQLVFVPDLCRSVMTLYQKDVEFHGIRLRRFELSENNFKSSKEIPQNSCYDKSFELPSGVMEVGPCKKGAPIVMSRPHFLDATARFSQEVKGMNPDKVKHEFIMDHEPTTGMTVSVRGRLQANIRIEKSDITSDFESIPNMVLPLFWQELYVEAGPGIVAFLKQVLGYPALIKTALTILTLIGLIVAIIGGGLLVNHARNAQKSNITRAKQHKVTYSKAPTTESA